MILGRFWPEKHTVQLMIWSVITCVLTTALENASPSPALLIEPWEPPLKARKPKSRMRKPRQTKGMEWPGIPPAFVHLSVLVGRNHVISPKSSYKFKIDPAHRCHLAPRITQPGKERTAPAKWTTAEPAKSVNPLRSHQIPASSDHHSVISHQCSGLTLVRAIQVPSKTSGLLLDRPRQWPKHWEKNKILWLYTLPSVINLLLWKLKLIIFQNLEIFKRNPKFSIFSENFHFT